jgi:hypothetical protein
MLPVDYKPPSPAELDMLDPVAMLRFGEWLLATDDNQPQSTSAVLILSTVNRGNIVWIDNFPTMADAMQVLAESFASPDGELTCVALLAFSDLKPRYWRKDRPSAYVSYGASNQEEADMLDAWYEVNEGPF